LELQGGKEREDWEGPRSPFLINLKPAPGLANFTMRTQVHRFIPNEPNRALSSLLLIFFHLRSDAFRNVIGLSLKTSISPSPGWRASEKPLSEAQP
jgi:hypothetical protein